MTRFVALLSVTLLACGADDYPPCGADDGVIDGPGGPVHGPTDPGPTPGPGPDPDGYTPRYRTNERGEVCECGVYELGCVDSPSKAKGSAQPGAYCQYPREDGDPVLAGGGLEVDRDPTRPYCKCWWTMYDVCGNQLPQTTELYGDNAAACEGKLRELLGLYNSTRDIQDTNPRTGHDLESIQCVPR